MPQSLWFPSSPLFPALQYFFEIWQRRLRIPDGGTSILFKPTDFQQAHNGVIVHKIAHQKAEEKEKVLFNGKTTGKIKSTCLPREKNDRSSRAQCTFLQCTFYFYLKAEGEELYSNPSFCVIWPQDLERRFINMWDHESPKQGLNEWNRPLHTFTCFLKPSRKAYHENWGIARKSLVFSWGGGCFLKEKSMGNTCSSRSVLYKGTFGSNPPSTSFRSSKDFLDQNY